MNKYFYIIISFLLFLTACESREDIFELRNEAPIMKIGRTDDVSKSQDTLVFNSRYGDDIVFYYHIKDDFLADKAKISYSVFPLTQTELSLEFEQILPNKIIIKDGQDNKVIKADYKAEIDIITTDFYGKTYSNKITIIKTCNKAPKPIFSVKKDDNNDYIIDATASIDPNGDKIVSYEYLIGGEIMFDKEGYETSETGKYCINPGHAARYGTYIVNSPLNNIKHVFQSAGVYEVAVRCKDNIGMWSKWSKQEITIQ